jgi:hypothetical protein
VKSQEIAPPTRSGLQTAIDIIVAPTAAFASLRVVPTWGWALIVTAVLAVVSSIVTGPAIGHALSVEMPAKLAQQYASLPADKRDAAIAQAMSVTMAISKFSFIFVLLILPISGLIQALIMLIANAVGQGDGTFKKFWALSINTSVVGLGCASVVLMIIVLIRGADSFNSSTEVAASVPSLALIVPGASKMLATFLGVFNIFNIWATALLAGGMTIMARIPRNVATGFAVLMLFCSAAFAAFGAR